MFLPFSLGFARRSRARAYVMRIDRSSRRALASIDHGERNSTIVASRHGR